MKPKEWLYKNGHITKEEVNRRGRMSKVNVDLILAAVANGESIDGYSVVKPTVSTDKPETVTVERVKSDPNSIPDVPEMSRDEREVMAYRFEDGKRVEVGMRTVDNNCGSSLSFCRCESPRVWVDYDREVVVNFGPRN